MNFYQLQRYQQPRRSWNPSIISLDSLNYDCLLAILQYLPFKDLLRVRYQCRSLNNAVLQHLRQVRKLAIFLNVDNKYDFNEPVFRKLVPVDMEDGRILYDQSHFRLEDFIYLNSYVHSGPSMYTLDRKLGSLILFLTNHMTNLTKLALLIEHEDYFRWIPYMLAPLRKLKVLLMEMATSDVGRFPETLIADAVSGLPELDSLHYFASGASYRALFSSSYSSRYIHPPNHWHMLSTGENFLVAMLSKLRVLHTSGLYFPHSLGFYGIEEMKIDMDQLETVRLNYFPGLRKLFVQHERFLSVFGQVRRNPCQFENLIVLVMRNELDPSYPGVMEGLNALPSLLDLHCMTVLPNVQHFAGTNDRIIRLYTKYYNYQEEGKFYWCHARYEWNNISVAKIDGYGAFCKQIFRGLRMLTNEFPKHVIEFAPARGDNRLRNH